MSLATGDGQLEATLAWWNRTPVAPDQRWRKKGGDLQRETVRSTPATTKLGKTVIDKLTGKIRYRSEQIGGLFSKRTVLVLQVQCTWSDGPDDMHGLPTYLAGLGWRDARVEDLTTLLASEVHE